LYASFQKEKAVQAKAYEDFQTDLKKNTNYNARFLPIVSLVGGKSHRLVDDENERALVFNEFFTQKMSVEDLYVSGHWEGIIQSWVVLQMNVIKDKDKFAQDFKIMSEKIKSPIHYTDFVGKMTYYLTQYGKDDYIDSIARTVLSSGKVTEYLGSMQVYLKAIIGMQAPDLAITEHIGKLEDHNHKSTILKSSELAMGNYTQTLLVFYQSGCGPCEALMQILPGKYEALKEQGIRVISLSADEGELLYKNSSKDYPWPDKYCDFEGKNGLNFKNYAVKGTPTLFLLDKKGAIVQKTATLEEILRFHKIEK
jgi:thioredoxin-related protein